MKKMVIVLSTIAVIGLMMGFSCITVRAEEYSDYARKWLEKQREQQSAFHVCAHGIAPFRQFSRFIALNYKHIPAAGQEKIVSTHKILGKRIVFFPGFEYNGTKLFLAGDVL